VFLSIPKQLIQPPSNPNTLLTTNIAIASSDLSNMPQATVLLHRTTTWPPHAADLTDLTNPLQSRAIWVVSAHKFTGIVAHEIRFLCLEQKM
jgi:hypothetical protein